MSCFFWIEPLILQSHKPSQDQIPSSDTRLLGSLLNLHTIVFHLSIVLLISLVDGMAENTHLDFFTAKLLIMQELSINSKVALFLSETLSRKRIDIHLQ